MHSRFTMVAAIAALAAAPIGAEPPKAPAVQASQPAKPAEILLASADIRAPGTQSDAQPTTVAKRPRAARVTTCRCGGQVPER